MRAIALVASKPRWRTVRAAEGIGTSTIPAAYDRCRQQGVHAQCQPFGKDPSQDQRLSLLVRVDQSAQELVVRGGGDCQREAVWPRRRDGERMAVESPSSWRQVGQSPHQGCSQPWQLAPSSRSPAAAAQSSKPTGRVWRAASSAATRARQSVDSHARRLKSAGHAVPIASSWIGDGADRVIEERLPSRAVVLPGSAVATDHDHRLRLRRDSELIGVEVLGLALLSDE